MRQFIRAPSDVGASYLAFDIAGDLIVGTPLGMLKATKDADVVPKRPDSMNSRGGKEMGSEVVGVPDSQLMGGRGESSVTVGVLPSYWRPIVKRLPGYKSKNDRMKSLARIAITAIADRIANPTDHDDFLNKLQSIRDAEGKPMSREELTAEAVTFLIAGSDTISE